MGGGDHAASSQRHSLAERVAFPGEDLDGLKCLEGPDNPRDDAKNAVIGATAAALGPRGHREQTPVARAWPPSSKGVPFKNI